MNVVALVVDLMDRSRLVAAIPDARAVGDPGAAAGADVVIVDLDRFGAHLGEVRAAAPTARIVGYGPHVDEELLARATASGADVVMARSRFFRDPLAAVAQTP